MTIGSGADNIMQINDKGIAAKHLELTYDGDYFYFKDISEKGAC